MTFHEAATRFSNAASGTDNFKLLAHDAFALMQSDSGNASLYFVIGIAANAYVRKYEDQGVSGEFADRAQATMVELNAKISQALAADADTRLRLGSEAAVQYYFQVSDF
ncbi:MAG: hypothetical protein EOP93_15565 [Lysobacteraceae bacterium]|nr:MAG: hypothetical protein EOP93_15565 [Xanthomonadaceae bacterium]